MAKYELYSYKAALHVYFIESPQLIMALFPGETSYILIQSLFFFFLHLTDFSSPTFPGPYSSFQFVVFLT